MSPPKPTTQTLMGHPTGLYVLAYVEMWERFAYFGTRGLLVFFLIREFGLRDSQAYALYGVFTALVLASPIVGGILTDRLGTVRSAVLLGGVLSASGIMLLSQAGSWAVYGGLALVITGSALLKPNITVLIAQLYPDLTRSRDAGFTLSILYVEIGAALAPLLCGLVADAHGWHYGFLLAGLGILSGLSLLLLSSRVSVVVAISQVVVLLVGLHSVDNNPRMTMVLKLLSVLVVVFTIPLLEALRRGGLPAPRALPSEKGLGSRIQFLMTCLGVTGLATWLLFGAGTSEGAENLVQGLCWSSVLLSFGWLLSCLRGSSAAEKRELGLFLLLMMVNGCSVGLLTLVDPSVAELSAGHPLSLSFELEGPVLPLVLFTIWTLLKWRQKEPSLCSKFGIAMAALGMGFFAFAMAEDEMGWSGLVSLHWIVIGSLCIYLNTLILYPTARSCMTLLGPKASPSTKAGAWFSGAMFGIYFATSFLKAGDPTADTQSGLWLAGVTAAILALLCFAANSLLRCGPGAQHPNN
jgi:proton-dependent oligopeptide transporter, POT family